MALRTSWLARPPTAAANGGRVPLAVLDRQRTNSAFTEDWKARGRKEGMEKSERWIGYKKKIYVHLCRFKKKYKKKRKAPTLFLRVAFTSSVSVSKTSASCKHLKA